MIGKTFARTAKRERKMQTQVSNVFLIGEHLVCNGQVRARMVNKSTKKGSKRKECKRESEQEKRTQTETTSTKMEILEK